MIINNSNLAILNQAFNAAFKGGLALATPTWREIAMVVSSTTASETYGWLGSSTRFREWVGDRVFQNLKTHSYSIVNKTFENTVEVPREVIEDDQYGIYTPAVQQLGYDTTMFPDELVYSAIIAGGSTLCYDGQYFFDTDHPVGSASVSNSLTGAGNAWYLLDTSKPVKPVIYQDRRPFRLVPKTKLDDDNVFEGNKFVWGVDGRCNVGYGLWQLAVKSQATLDDAGYSAAYAAMLGFKSDTGKPLGVKPTVLLVGPSNYQAALKVVQAETLANGATNVNRGTAKVVVTGWLA